MAYQIIHHTTGESFTDDAVVVDHKTKMKVNESRVIFTNPKTLKEESIDVSRLIRVFVNNVVGQRKSIK